MDRAPGRPALPGAPPAPGRDDPISEHVRAALHVRLRAVLAHEAGARQGADPEELHQLRVAVRRMRAVLRSARPFLDKSWSEPLRAELGWLGRSLGPVRDLDVLLDRLRGDAAELDEAERPAAEQLLAGLDAAREQAREQLIAALDSDRCAELIHSLAEAVRGPLPTSGTSEDTARELRALVAAQYRKLRRAVDELPADPTDEQLHELRILGKRLRYTAELAGGVLGRPMKQLLTAVKAVQDVLGEHQDACVAEQRVRDLLAERGDAADVEVAFAAGRLVERERARRAEHRARWWQAWRELRNRAAAV